MARHEVAMPDRSPYIVQLDQLTLANPGKAAAQDSHKTAASAEVPGHEVALSHH
uniref:Uncharacterized protein n=1 Tax=Anguilla anguilla TaxID=7936 RepID=A0A0E9SB29_ANGAN